MLDSFLLTLLTWTNFKSANEGIAISNILNKCGASFKNSVFYEPPLQNIVSKVLLSIKWSCLPIFAISF